MNKRAKAAASITYDVARRSLNLDQGLIDIKALAYFTSMSERLIFNSMKDEAFLKLKIGRRLLFEKRTVLEYLIRKYGNSASSV